MTSNMSEPKQNPGPIPPKWLHCPRKSENLIVGKFMVLKTPLSSDFDDIVPAECRFVPKMMFDFAKFKKIKFGLWIDLTNTTRFYNKSEIEDYDCKYIKLQANGDGETPSLEQTKAFIKLVYNYISKYPLQSIAVHCTYGFNVTGFLIVSYLVEMMDYSVVKALGLFRESRPVGIYKEDYLLELYRRYDEIEDAPSPPELPYWYTEGHDTSDNDFGDSTEEVCSSSNRDGISSKLKKDRKLLKFMEGVSGVKPVENQAKARALQKKVEGMCRWRWNDFPGSQPVLMNGDNIKLLHEKPYRVSWKAVGMRYMMLIDGENEIYFFDREHNVFKVKGLKFVHRKDIRRHIRDTLIDGEMVIDKVNGQDIPRYLIYDIVMFENQKVGQMPFHPVRLQCIENEIIKPRYFATEQSLINKSSEPFGVRKKDFWPITQANSLLGEKFANTLSYKPGGLIFQPSKSPYTAGRCDEVLEWMPQQSVDFRLKIVTESEQGMEPKKMCYLYVGREDDPYSTMEYTEALEDLNDKIIECCFEDNQWTFMRERKDRSYPNGRKTVTCILESIKNPITKVELLDYIDKYRFEVDSEMMPPPSKMIKR